MKLVNYKAIVWLVLPMVFSCVERMSLPILGETSVDAQTGDLVYYKAPEFELKNQLNGRSSRANYDGKIQVIDFFFTSCPTICPQMTSHLKLVEDAFASEEKVAIISYSIDPENDTPERLKAYAGRHQINEEKWTFLTGETDEVFALAKDYKVRAFDDSWGDERNLIHDGTFVLVDGQHRIRGYYNGLEERDTKRLIADIEILLNE